MKAQAGLYSVARMRHTPLLAALTVAALVVGTACTSDNADARSETLASPTSPQTGADATVTIADMAFSPTNVDVSAGDTVAWVWNDGHVPHDVTFEHGQSSSKEDDGTWQRTFDRAGSYTYQCTLHPFMHGTVTVR